MRVSPSPLFLGILLLSFFGAGTFDVLFADVIPFRPYDSFLRNTIPAFTQPTRGPVLLSPELLLFTVALLLLITALALHTNLLLLPLTGRARIHASHPHTAGRHRDYAPLRNRTLATQINIPLEDYIKEKQEAFEKQYPRKPRQIGEEILWQD